MFGLREHAWRLGGLVMMATSACTAPPEAGAGAPAAGPGAPTPGATAGSVTTPGATAGSVTTPGATAGSVTTPGATSADATSPAGATAAAVTPPVPDAAAPASDGDAVSLPEGLRAPGFMFVFRGSVVLETEADPTWGTGPTTRKALDYATEGHRAVDATRVPARLTALAGAAVKLYGPKGVVCEGRLGTPSLYGYHQGDEIPPDPDAGEDTLPSMPHLVAALTKTSGDCKQALWARGAELPPPLLFRVQKRVDPALAKRAREAAAAHPSYVQLAADYQEFLTEVDADAKAKPWPKFVAANTRVTAWTHEAGRKLVLVELGDAENIRCEAYFTGSASILFEALGDELRLLGAEDMWRPQAIVDVDGDGAIEVLRLPSNELGGILLANYKLADEVRFPSEDIGCVDADGEGGEFGDEP